MEILYLALGLVLGGIGAIIIMSMLFISKHADFEQERMKHHLDLRQN